MVFWTPLELSVVEQGLVPKQVLTPNPNLHTEALYLGTNYIKLPYQRTDPLWEF